jgi:hypothetical protein
MIFWGGVSLGSVTLAFAQVPTSADFQSSYDGIIKQLSTDNVSVHAQLLADQRELAKLSAVEKERDELKAKLAESAAVRGSTNPPK